MTVMPQEPILFQLPLSLLFLYFVWYSFLGWIMETIYCSVRQKHFVARGFLHGPVCPIYGVGALLMVLLLKPFTRSIPLFFVISTVTMSAWEYLVGWALETTTHIKYWDYSNEKYNLKGRICLKNSMYWGIVSYIALFWLHPRTVSLFALLRAMPRCVLSAVMALVMLGDTAFTIRGLALAAVFLQRAEAAREELEARRRELLLAGHQRLEEAAVQSALLRLELRHKNLLGEAAHYSHRFRMKYHTMTSERYVRTLERLHRNGEQLRAERQRRMERLRWLQEHKHR